MKIEMTNKDGVTLLTAGKYCTENIEVVPAFEMGADGTAIEVTSAEGMAQILATVTAEDYGKIYLYTGTTTADYKQGVYYVLEPGEPEPEPELTPTEGLAYSKSSTYATCTGIGKATDRDIVIASEYEGVPVTSIGNYAFQNCHSLASVHIPDSVTSIGSYAFNSCYSLTSVEIPDSVTSIGYNAFSNCSALTNINIPDGVTSIGDSAFSNCSALANINIPDGVTSIGINVFQNCKALTSVEIPDSVTSIGYNAFYNCSALANINIPDGVTSIGGSAFYNCYSLAKITVNAITPPTLGTSAFNSIASNAVIYVPAESVDAYKSATNWSNYASKIQAIS